MATLSRHREERSNDYLIDISIAEVKRKAQQAADKYGDSFVTKATIQYRVSIKYISIEIRLQRRLLRKRIQRLRASIERDPEGPDAQRAARRESFHWDIEAMEQERNDLDNYTSVYLERLVQTVIQYALKARHARAKARQRGDGPESDLDGPSDAEEGELDLREEEEAKLPYIEDGSDCEVGEVY